MIFLKINKIIFPLLFTLLTVFRSESMESMEKINEKVENLLAKSKVTDEDVTKIEKYMGKVEEWRDSASDQDGQNFDAQYGSIETISSILHSYREDPSINSLEEAIRMHIQ